MTPPKKNIKINWDKLDPYYEKLHKRDTLFIRTLQPQIKKKLDEACSQTIDFLLKELHLKKWEAYFVVKTMFESFPLEDIVSEVFKR